MPAKEGLWISVGGEEKAEQVERAIEDGGRFTAAASTLLSLRKAELCLVSFTGEKVEYIGISQVGPRIATGQKRISVSRLVDLGGISLQSIRDRLPKRFRSAIADVMTESRRISPRLWENMLQTVVALYPSAAEGLKSLKKLVVQFNSVTGRQDGGLEIFERDAIASVLQAWGGTKYRKRVLRTAAPASDDTAAPFLTRLRDVSVTMREDPQIANDAATFPGMEVAMRYQVGAVELENDSGERLTIMNCNRQPLEQALGVDLIYYNHNFDSFIFVQYKRMVPPTSGFGKAVYRPEGDSNYAKEVERIKAIQELVTGAAPPDSKEVGSYRLSSHPFYFKLCEARLKSALDEGMVSGMYLPIELWDRFIGSAAARGKLGGLAVGWDNCPRHFNNSEFTGMLRRGWIGSAPGESKILDKLIGKVLEGDRMLILAFTTSAEGREDYLRDQFGRFASEDDPSASR